jgi:hypothetical protein
LENLKNERNSQGKSGKPLAEGNPSIATPHPQPPNQLHGLRTASDGLQGPALLGAQQPKHFTNPLKYAKPFDLKLSKPMEPEWGAIKPRDKKLFKPQNNRSSLIA